ncbi:MAG TPA: DUF2157 domain-containing protein, partial [Mycobacteriales bacterium]|nr:DUF2157 domain-containing protein [Mycobacteriales bacterium]
MSPTGTDRPDTRSGVVTVLAGLGVTLLGVGVLWLVASVSDISYEGLPPAARFALVAVPWLGVTVVAVRARRFAAPLRLLSALLLGGVVLQGAESLGTRPYNPALLLVWAAGALALGYGTRSAGPLTVGVTAGLAWYVGTLIAAATSVASFVLGTALATPVLAAVAVAHRDDRLGAPWLRMASLTALLALLVAAFPGALTVVETRTRPVLAGAAGALIAVVAAALRARHRRDVAELGGAVAVAASAWALVETAPKHHWFFLFGPPATERPLVHALLASGAFVAAAAGIAAAGAARRLPGLVSFAAVALALFV